MNEQLQLNLSFDILTAHNAAQDWANRAKEYAHNAVESAVECGNLLIRQKEHIGDSSFAEWVEKHLPDISQDTLLRYVKAAKVAQLMAIHANEEGEDEQNKPALQAVGLLALPDTTITNPNDPQKGWVKYVRIIDSFRKWYNKRTEDRPLAQWDDNARRLLKNELKWIVDLHNTL